MDQGIDTFWACLNEARWLYRFLRSGRGSHVVAPGGDGARSAMTGEDRIFPLDAMMQEQVERTFSADFSRVRIHVGPEADMIAARNEAAAVTVGTDIYFASGRYSPDTEEGMRLLVHELQHVVQHEHGARMVYAEEIGDLEAEALMIEAYLSTHNLHDARLGDLAGEYGQLDQQQYRGEEAPALAKREAGVAGSAALQDFASGTDASPQIAYHATTGEVLTLTKDEYLHGVETAKRQIRAWIAERGVEMTEEEYARFIIQVTERLRQP